MKTFLLQITTKALLIVFLFLISSESHKFYNMWYLQHIAGKCLLSVGLFETAILLLSISEKRKLSIENWQLKKAPLFLLFMYVRVCVYAYLSVEVQLLT